MARTPTFTRFNKPCPAKFLQRNPYARVRSLPPFSGMHMTTDDVARRWRKSPKTFANTRSDKTAKGKATADTGGPTDCTTTGPRSKKSKSKLILPFLRLGRSIRYRFADVLKAEAAALRMSTSDPGPPE